MAYLALADFLEILERERLLTRVAAAVDPDLELAAISQRVAREQGPSLLFTQVAGAEFPVAVNLLHSTERVCRALGVAALSDVSRRLQEQLQAVRQESWWDALRPAPQARWVPRMVKNGACQQVVRLASDVDLATLLRIRWWPEEAALALPAAVAFVQSPDDAWRSVELCGVTLLDRQQLLLDWEPHRGLARLWHERARHDAQLPVAISLGGHPVDTLVAAAPLTAETDRWALAGWLRGRSCDLVRCRTIPLDVPADAEIIVEGYLDPAASRQPIPRRAELTGFYSAPGEAVVMQVTAVTHRTQPVMVALAPSRPPHEVTILRHAMLEALKPAILALAPGLVDYHFPWAGGCRDAAVVSMDKSRPHQAQELAGALRALEPWLFTRWLVVVDADANVCDEREVQRRIVCYADSGPDLFLHASLRPTPLTINATRKLPGEQERTPVELQQLDRVSQQIAQRWPEYGLRPNDA